MGKKSKRGSGPRPGSNRAERVAARKARQEAAMAPVPRPFEGLAAECDLVALRSFVASATVEWELSEPGPAVATPTSVLPDETPAVPAEEGKRNDVIFGSILPGAVPALVRDIDGAAQGLVALQADPDPEDIADGLAAAVQWASHAAPGEDYVYSAAAPLTDLVKADAPLKITVHDDFGWWFPPGTDVPAEVAAMVERADDTVLPTARVSATGINGAPWWVDAGERAHLRWVRPESEDDLMTALARLHAADRLTLGEGSRFAGSFRTHGLLVPVFDLDNERHHEEWFDAVVQFEEWLGEALAQSGELSTAEVGSRDGIRARQVTLQR